MNLNVKQRRERKRSQKRARATPLGRDLAALMRAMDRGERVPTDEMDALRYLMGGQRAVFMATGRINLEAPLTITNRWKSGVIEIA